MREGVRESVNTATKIGRIPNAIPLQKIKISQKGIQNIEKHLTTMDFDKANQVMLKRLKNIAAGKAKSTNADLNFYAHELREMELMKRGMGYSEAHKRAFKEYGIEYKRGYESCLYTKEALSAGEADMLEEFIRSNKR